MTASKAAKDAGLPSLKCAYTTANIDKSKIIRWYNNNRQLFDVVVAGVKTMQFQHEQNILNYKPDGFYTGKSLKDSGEIK